MVRRPEGYRSLEAGIPGNVRPRHVMGFISRVGSHVIQQVNSEKDWLPRSGPKFSARHRSLDASNKPLEEG